MLLQLFIRYQPHSQQGVYTCSQIGHKNTTNKLGGAYLFLFSVLLRCVTKKQDYRDKLFKKKIMMKKDKTIVSFLILCFITPTAEKYKT